MNNLPIGLSKNFPYDLDTNSTQIISTRRENRKLFWNIINNDSIPIENRSCRSIFSENSQPF